MKKQVIRLTESDLHRIIKESVKRIIRESEYENPRLGYDEYIMKEILKAGAKKISKYPNFDEYFNEPPTDENGYVDLNDDYMDMQIPFDEVKELLTPETLNSNEVATYQWILSTNYGSYCSMRNFDDEDEALEDCDRIIKILGDNNFEAEVIAIDRNSDGTFTVDPMYVNEGDMWMD